MTNAKDELTRVFQHFQVSDDSCIPLREMLRSKCAPAKMLVVAVTCKGDLNVESDIISRLHLFPGEPSVGTSAGRGEILDDWDLVNAPGLRGFNGMAGGKGNTQYLIGFDREFVEKAQAHVKRFAGCKRERLHAMVASRRLSAAMSRKRKSVPPKDTRITVSHREDPTEYMRQWMYIKSHPDCESVPPKQRQF